MSVLVGVVAADVPAGPIDAVPDTEPEQAASSTPTRRRAADSMRREGEVTGR